MLTRIECVGIDGYIHCFGWRLDIKGLGRSLYREPGHFAGVYIPMERLSSSVADRQLQGDAGTFAGRAKIEGGWLNIELGASGIDGNGHRSSKRVEIFSSFNEMLTRTPIEANLNRYVKSAVVINCDC